MKKIALASLITLFTLPALAQTSGGFQGPGDQQTHGKGGFSGDTASLSSVKDVKTLKDDQWVALEGNIDKRTGDDKYIFRDATGTLTAEIDDKRWNGQNVTPKDKVRLEGKIDKDWDSEEIDVKKVNIIN
ncbi:YgiW/YdeI family stress tolerance OB fold protein [Serratia sp. M24T3]|uniref:YgiW/YdeI family stress tolerance OB fold protein n=1 Tax=Rouxiella sp. WC2420 TaxID=3234145 RepID=A0AB39VZK4_9GAMM|nr:YgiW/YdeI family stress tolerance OB fold protein [Serratia sp. M24T3]